MDFLTPIIVGLHVASVHVPTNTLDNNANIGIYAESKTGLTVHVYKNTFNKTSLAIGQSWTQAWGAHVSGSIELGAVSGYKRSEFYGDCGNGNTGSASNPCVQGATASGIIPYAKPSILFFKHVRLSVIPGQRTVITLGIETSIGE